MTVQAGCSAECCATPECAVCRRAKKLMGRDYPSAMGGGYCDGDCPGYALEPRAGHLWWSEWRDHERGDHRGCFADCGGVQAARCERCEEYPWDCECKP